MGRAQSYVMREYGGAHQFGVAMYRIDAKENRNRRVRPAFFQRLAMKLIGEVQPCLRGGAHIAAGRGTAAGENRAELVSTQILR